MLSVCFGVEYRFWNSVRIFESQSQPEWLSQARRIASTETGFFLIDENEQRWHVLHRPAIGGTLWARSPIREAPPIHAADTTLAIVLLAGLLLGSPIVTLLAGLELKRELRVIEDGLRQLAVTQPSLDVAGSTGRSRALPTLSADPRK